jgi:hypothetical protein
MKTIEILNKYLIILEQETKKQFTEEQAKEIGDKLGINWNEISLKEFSAGVNTELEHGSRDSQTNVTNDDPLMTGKIALAHLKEKKDYYTELKKMESK